MRHFLSTCFLLMFAISCGSSEDSTDELQFQLFHRQERDTATTRSNPDAPTPELWLNSFGSAPAAGGWCVDKHPRMLADVNGDGLSDVVGFGYAGVYVSLSDGSHFLPKKLWIDTFGYSSSAGEWRVNKHPRMLADVNGDGLSDVVGFGYAGVYVSLSDGSRFLPKQLWIDTFGYSSSAGEWRVNKHPRMLADVNGDGLSDVVGFGYAGVYVSLSNGFRFLPKQRWADTYGYASSAGNWRVDKHPRLVIDVNADGLSDVVGFGNAGVYVSLSTGIALSTRALWIDAFGAVAGNWDAEHPRTLTDVNGDNLVDVIGFSDAGVVVSTSSGTDFSDPELWVAAFGSDTGNWQTDKHPRLVSDINGDGLSDVVGFGDQGVFVSLSTALDFLLPRLAVDGFGANAGWTKESSVRLTADVDGDGAQEIMGFGSNGVYVCCP